MYFGYAVRDGSDLPNWWYVLTAGAAGGPALSQPGPVAVENAKSAGPLVVLWPYAVVALCTHVALGAWFVSRYGRKATGRPTSLEASPVVEKSWLAPPRRGTWTAIIWQQARMTAPLAVALGGAVLLTAVIFACYAELHERNVAIQVLLVASFGAWAAVGLCAAVPAGIAVFLEDLQPRLLSFWRSRPVNVDQWFAAKFFTGLLIPTLILPLPALASLLLFLAAGEPLPNDGDEIVRTAAGFLVAHIGLYCTSVLMIILVRQAAYAAILSLAAVGLFIAGMQFVAPYASGASVAWAAVVVTIAVTALAWLALRKNWGWSP
jgi:hypothetical protein